MNLQALSLDPLRSSRPHPRVPTWLRTVTGFGGVIPGRERNKEREQELRHQYRLVSTTTGYVVTQELGPKRLHTQYAATSFGVNAFALTATPPLRSRDSAMYLSALPSNHWGGVPWYTTNGEGCGKPQLSPTTRVGRPASRRAREGFYRQFLTCEATDISLSLIHDTHGRVVASCRLPLGARLGKLATGSRSRS